MGSLSESFIQKLQGQLPQSHTNAFSQTSAPTRGTPSQSLKHSSQQFNCTAVVQASIKNQLVAFTRAFVEFTPCWSTRPVRINHSPLGSIWSCELISPQLRRCKLAYFYKHTGDKGHTPAPSSTRFYCKSYHEYIKI